MAAAHPKKFPFGVNVGGFLTGEFGNGESARASVRALRAANIPHALNNVSCGLQGQRDSTLADFTTDNPYAVNLVHVNADSSEAFRGIAGKKYFKGRYNIGLWWWELERFPDCWRNQSQLYHEIWTQSSFCQKSIARVAQVPVVLIPHVVQVDESAARPNREQFGIPNDCFAFLFSFDFLSFIERKNPSAVIRAFRLAFGKSTKVRLIIKSINGHLDPIARHRLEREATGPNVVFMSERFTRRDMLSLFASCDCYVSLHRAEGFGLGMAESMYLSKPVIATGFSGNMDFMNSRNSFLVRYRLTDLERDYGPYKKGNRWAEPDVQHAASLMQLVRKDRNLSEVKAQRAADDMRNRHSPEIVGQLIVERLRASLKNREDAMLKRLQGTIRRVMAS